MPIKDVEFDCYEVSKRLRQLREDRKLTQHQLAEKLDVSEQVIKNYEKAYLTNGQATGRTSDKTKAIAGMKIETLHKIAQIFNVSTDYILGLSDIKLNEPDAGRTIQYTGLAEENVHFLNSCMLLLRAFTMYPPDSFANEQAKQHDEYATSFEKHGLKRKEQRMYHFDPDFQTEEVLNLSQTIFKDIESSGDDLLNVYGMHQAALQLVNELISIVSQDGSIVKDYTTLVGILSLGRYPLDCNAEKFTGAADDIYWHYASRGMTPIADEELIRFRAHEIGASIERNLLMRHSHGTY